MRVLFIIRSLDFGGAERQLVQLAQGLADRFHTVAIVTMYGGGALSSEVPISERLQLISLNKTGRWDNFRAIKRLIDFGKTFRPDIVHGYMSGANELALLMGTALRAKVIWGVRVSDQQFDDYSVFRRVVFWAGVTLSRMPSLIIANSVAGKRFHESYGYPESRTKVIPNGIDTQRFAVDPAAGERWRQNCGFGSNEKVILLPARLDPMKDHTTFLRAARVASSRAPTLRFLAIGSGPAEQVRMFHEQILSPGLADRVSRSDSIRDVSAAYNGADVVTLTSSFGEGFPNVLGEAMACGAACVSTDVGDASLVLGDNGTICPIGDHQAIASAWLSQIAIDPESRALMRSAARDRIESQFSIDRLTSKSEDLFASLLET